MRKGVYALGAHPDVRDAAAHGGELACAAALRAHGVWVLEEIPTLHVWLGPDGRSHPHPSCACIVHRDAGASAFGVVDFLVDGRLIIEVDGRPNHDGVSLRHKDLVRDAEAAAQGCETLRFDCALVVRDWPRVQRARRVQRACARDAWGCGGRNR